MRFPAAVILASVLVLRCSADPRPKTAEDHLREALAHDPVDLNLDCPLAESTFFLMETLQVAIVVDPKAIDTRKTFAIKGEHLKPREALQLVLDTSGLKEINVNGTLLWTSEERAKKFAGRTKFSLPEKPTELDREAWKLLTGKRVDLDFTDSQLSDILECLGQILSLKITLNAGGLKAFSFVVMDTTCVDVLEILAFLQDTDVRMTDGELTLQAPNWVAPPVDLKAKFEKGVVRLDWKSPAPGDECIVAVDRPEGPKEIARTRECFLEISDAPKRAEVKYLVSRVSPEGKTSLPAEQCVGTWPPEYVRGTEKLLDWRMAAFDFGELQFVPFDKDELAGLCDFSINRTHLTKTGYPLAAAHGVALGVPGAFGDFDRAEERVFRRSEAAREIALAFTQPIPLVFRLITRDGGYAHVRFEGCAGDFRMTYVYLPPPKPPPMTDLIRALAARAPAVDPAETARLAAAGNMLGDEDAAKRDAAEKVLREADLNAVSVLAEIVEHGKDLEAKARAKTILEELWADQD